MTEVRGRAALIVIGRYGGLSASSPFGGCFYILLAALSGGGLDGVPTGRLSCVVAAFVGLQLGNRVEAKA